MPNPPNAPFSLANNTVSLPLGPRLAYFSLQKMAQGYQTNVLPFSKRHTRTRVPTYMPGSPPKNYGDVLLQHSSIPDELYHTVVLFHRGSSEQHPTSHRPKEVKKERPPTWGTFLLCVPKPNVSELRSKAEPF